jgi:hypothetical protein
MMCAGETLCIWDGEEGLLFSGLLGRADYDFLLNDLHRSWAALTRAIELNEQVGAQARTALFTLIFSFY